MAKFDCTMKKFLYLSVLVVISVTFLSCQKEAEPGPDTTTYKVKTYTEDIVSNTWGDQTVTFNLSYDASDRVTAMTDASNPGNRFEFAYKTGGYSMDLYNLDALEIHEDFFLDANNLIDSTVQYNSTGDTSTSKHLYNSNKQLITTLEYDYSILTGSELWNTVNYTYDGSGNLVRSVDTDKYEEIFEYYADQVSVMPGLSPYSIPKKQNLLKKFTVKSNGTLLGSAEYTYTFDSKGRISTQKVIDSDGGTVTKTFTYF